jgi:hydroxymethylpyrimidine kinase/phosphomethylpyrimidine kinase
MTEQTIPRVLTIAGSDSGGGAGIEADLKAMTALGCYGMAAVTAVTAQNTRGVTAIHDIPPETVRAQIDAVLNDIGADAAKTGMLSSTGIIEAVAAALTEHPVEKLVIDPVMVAKSGDALLRENARDTLADKLLPRAFMITPNIPEAALLAGMRIATEADLPRAAVRILEKGPRWVLMKGGHMESEEAVDLLFGGGETFRFTAPRIATENTHGTGCTFSAAIACFLARGDDAPAAVEKAKAWLTGAIRNALPLGGGHGPLHHMWDMERNT